MTGKLPSDKQLSDASIAFAAASHYAFSCELFSHEIEKAEILHISAIKALKVGVEVLGYEIVERVPATPQTPDKGANASVNDMARRT